MNIPLSVALVTDPGRRRRWEIALEAGMSADKFSRIVHRRVRPTADEQQAIADALKRDVRELFSNEE